MLPMKQRSKTINYNIYWHTIEHWKPLYILERNTKVIYQRVCSERALQQLKLMGRIHYN